MTARELNNKVSKLAKLQAKAAALDEQIKELHGEIKSEMNSRGIDELQTGIYTVRWTSITSSRFDSKAFQLDNPKLYAMYKTASTTNRFTLSVTAKPTEAALSLTSQVA